MTVAGEAGHSPSDYFAAKARGERDGIPFPDALLAFLDNCARGEYRSPTRDEIAQIDMESRGLFAIAVADARASALARSQGASMALAQQTFFQAFAAGIDG